MPQTATITNLPEAFEMIKEMRADGLEWGAAPAHDQPAAWGS